MIESTPSQMLRQKVGTSPAPGKTAPIPTMATSIIRSAPSRPRTVVYMTWVGPSGPAASSASRAATPSSGSMVVSPRRAYSASRDAGDHAPAGGRPRPPVDAHDPGVAQPVAPDPGEGVEGVVGGGVVGLAPVAVDAGDAAEQGEEAQAGVGRQGVGQGDGAGHLGLEHPGEGLGGLGRQQPVLADAGPVDDAVEPAVAGVDVVDHGLGPRPGRARRPRGSGRRRRGRRGRRGWPAPRARPGCGGRWPRPRPAGGRPTR